MNSIRWYIDTDTFREFHSVDNTRLHALPKIAKANGAVTQGPPTQRDPGTEDSERIHQLEHRHVTWWRGQSHVAASPVCLGGVRGRT